MVETSGLAGDGARARFAAATETYLSGALIEGVELRHVSHDEMVAVSQALWAEDGRPVGRPERLFSEEQRMQQRELDALLGEPLAHRVLLMRGGEPVGSYWGVQEGRGRYYMVNSVVRAAARGQGLYRALLDRVVATAAAAGFTEIYSRHRADNNAILVAKLKAGFVISAFEVSPKFGVLVHLRRYLDDGLATLARCRVDGVHAAALRAAGVLPEVG